jgi:hypothetical protein
VKQLLFEMQLGGSASGCHDCIGDGRESLVAGGAQQLLGACPDIWRPVLHKSQASTSKTFSPNRVESRTLSMQACFIVSQGIGASK